MIDDIKQQIRKRMFRDLITLLAFIIASSVIVFIFDAVNWINQTVQQLQIMDTYRFIPILGVLTLSFAIFSYRRWQDTKTLSLYAEELSMIDPMTNLPNRRAVQRILNQINERQEYPLGVALVEIEGLESVRSSLGITVAEHILIEYLYHISQELTEEQLIAYWQAGQFVCICPGMTVQEANLLQSKITKIKLRKDKFLNLPLNISCVTSSIHNKAELENVFKELEEQLL